MPTTRVEIAPLESNIQKPLCADKRSGIVVCMALSARNQLRGRVKEVTLGSVMSHIVVQVGENEIESVITKRSVEEMNLKVGDDVSAIIKSSDVIIGK